MRASIFFIAAALLTPPAQAAGQTSRADEVDVGSTTGNPRLGLLGLLGLVGLLGLRRREPDIHVDARRHVEM